MYSSIFHIGSLYGFENRTPAQKSRIKQFKIIIIQFTGDGRRGKAMWKRSTRYIQLAQSTKRCIVHWLCSFALYTLRTHFIGWHKHLAFGRVMHNSKRKGEKRRERERMRIMHWILNENQQTKRVYDHYAQCTHNHKTARHRLWLGHIIKRHILIKRMYTLSMKCTRNISCNINCSAPRVFALAPSIDWIEARTIEES